jgi:acetyl esterase
MTAPPAAEPRRDRVADVLLRGPSRRLRAHLRWPTATDAVPALAVLLGTGADSPDAQAVSAGRAGAVVLAALVESVAEAVAVVGWAADHARELGADPGGLVLVGTAAARDLVAAVAERAAAEGWPPLADVVVLRPADGRP